MTARLANIIVQGKALPKDKMLANQMLAHADSHHVLGQMAAQQKTVPEGKLAEVFKSALIRTEHDHRMLTFEMDRLERALSETGIQPILLKGAAYVAVGSPAAKGRRVSDIDILVPEHELAQVEAALRLAGWQADASTDNPYDQAYYRTHMHELPPLRHSRRGTILDIHHRLLPKTARLKVDHTAMMQAATVLEGRALKVFSPVDMVIHACVHAFADGAVDTPLRTVIELYYLFDSLNEVDKALLPERAQSVGAGVPVATALSLLGQIFADDEAAQIAKKLAPSLHTGVITAMVHLKLEGGFMSPFAKACLYVRSHYLRMPLYKLIPHLLTKAFNRPKTASTQVMPPFHQV